MNEFFLKYENLQTLETVIYIFVSNRYEISFVQKYCYFVNLNVQKEFLCLRKLIINISQSIHIKYSCTLMLIFVDTVNVGIC